VSILSVGFYCSLNFFPLLSLFVFSLFTLLLEAAFLFLQRLCSFCLPFEFLRFFFAFLFLRCCHLFLPGLLTFFFPLYFLIVSGLSFIFLLVVVVCCTRSVDQLLLMKPTRFLQHRSRFIAQWGLAGADLYPQPCRSSPCGLFLSSRLQPPISHKLCLCDPPRDPSPLSYS